MRAIIAGVLLAIVLGAGADAKSRHCTLRLHVGGNEQDSDVFATKARSQVTGRAIVIEKTPRISELDVVAFRPYPATDGTFGVLFQLDEHGKLALDTLSVEKRGSPVYVLINGRPVSELLIDRRIPDGRVYIRSGLTKADIDLMRKDWPEIGQRKR